MNETNDNISTVDDCKPPNGGRKKKLRRVRAIIRSSIDKLTTEKDKEQNPRKSSTQIPLDKRPFPFGHW